MRGPDFLAFFGSDNRALDVIESRTLHFVRGLSSGTGLMESKVASPLASGSRRHVELLQFETGHSVLASAVWLAVNHWACHKAWASRSVAVQGPSGSVCSSAPA